MRPFLYKFFHEETNDRGERGLVHIPHNKNDWPESWNTVEYKEYRIHQPIALPPTHGLLFDELLQKRKTTREAISIQTIAKEDIAYILRCGSGIIDPELERRASPSGGQRYPIELYLFLFHDIDDISAGIYHYNVKRDELECVRVYGASPEEQLLFSPYTWLKNAHGFFFMSTVFDRAVRKYGSRGYRYILLEAGHIAENMLLAGTEREVSLVPIGGFNETEVESLAGLLSSHERIIYSLYF